MRLYFYYTMFPVGLLSAVVLSVICSRKSEISPKKAVCYTLTGFLSGVLGAMLISVPYNFFLDFVYGAGNHSVSRFSLFGALIFMPVLIRLFCVKNSGLYDRITDVCTPGVYAVLAFGKLGCFVYGCCGGIECEACPVNPLTGRESIPVQFFECLFCLCLVIVGAIICNKLKTKGLVYPLLLTVYSVGRFFFQFLRNGSSAERNFTGFVDFWQCACLLTFFIGIFSFIYKKKIQKTV